ncbi:MAG: amino acid permease [Bacteroidetes bacterium]|nr:amino acid permease [Bacteroidota bacterium]
MKSKVSNSKGHGFGTAPVFLAAISTILGAILFLRFGYAVANVGLMGSLLIILIGHAITIPTALAIAEIATNLKVEGGGEYYIISRSFGSMVGGTIGISLYFSQAISVAFYMIAFGEAFTPLFAWIKDSAGIQLSVWMVSIPGTLILLYIIFRKGADIGVTALWIVVSILAISLAMFFAGGTAKESGSLDIFQKIANGDDFFIVFAIIFPAFTGMTAGVGLSGDLKNPRKSIPLGTLSATLVGMVVYVLVVFKLSMSLSPEELAADQFAMGKVAVWNPIIPIGLAAASLSSAIGSILIAPRTMQALAVDKIFPISPLNNILGKGKGSSNEPVNATIVTGVIALIFVSMGSVDFVAQIISMFFMITYGSLCLVSFMEHFAGNPSYRPTFRSKWYLSLLGAVACFIMMFQMAPLYAFLSIVFIILLYMSLKRGRDEDDLSNMLKGVLFQLTRKLQVLIQKKQSEKSPSGWRPSFIAVSSNSSTRLAPFDLLRWISHHHGFGTFIHFIKGHLNDGTNTESKLRLEQLIKQSRDTNAGIYVDTLISPSFKTAVAQIVQIPGISGMENNSILFEFHEDDHEDINDIIDGCQFASFVNFNICVLRSSERHFGYRKKINIWLTPGDYRNANLMIYLAYILLGHKEWKGSEIELCVAFDEDEMENEIEELNDLIDKGRIPFSKKNVNKVTWNKNSTPYESLVINNSENVDLVIMGFSLGKIIQEKGEFFKKFTNIKDILFVRAGHEIAIKEN